MDQDGVGAGTQEDTWELVLDIHTALLCILGATLGITDIMVVTVADIRTLTHRSKSKAKRASPKGWLIFDY